MKPMAQALHLSQKMTLSQVLAPQLQQSLALLQAPTLELKAMVAQELEQNPMLEELEITEMTQEEKESRADGRVGLPSPPARPSNRAGCALELVGNGRPGPRGRLGS